MTTLPIVGAGPRCNFRPTTQRPLTNETAVALQDVASSEIRLADLVGGLTPVAWHEAVALVHQIGRAVQDQPALGVAPLTGLHLGADGVVRIEPTPTATADIVPALADLLKSLLPPGAPEQLAALTDSTATEVREAGLNEFLTALTFFSRPDEVGDL
jgi:hypothetical protein